VDTPVVVPPSEHDDLRSGAVTSQRRFALALPADLITAAQVRAHLVAWLVKQEWPLAQQDDIVLAVSEAVSNSVEHGYGVRQGVAGRTGVVEVGADVVPRADGVRQIEITVRDHGGWQPHPLVRAHRRHGIPIMKACVADFELEGTAGGTTVVLRSRPVPA
jgi:serine/threonine-protein kinase RsbW